MTFCRETAIMAVRKRRLCMGCERFIEVGEAAVSCAGIWEGDFWSGDYHADCRKAEIALNHEYLDGYWSDDWSALHDWRDHDAGPWLKEKFPKVYLWLCQTREQRAIAAGSRRVEPAHGPRRAA